MAKSNKEPEEQVKEPVQVEEIKAPVYSASELAASSEAVFGNGVMPECVSAAFFVAEKTEATREEAKNIVKRFMQKEVK